VNEEALAYWGGGRAFGPKTKKDEKYKLGCNGAKVRKSVSVCSAIWKQISDRD